MSHTNPYASTEGHARRFLVPGSTPLRYLRGVDEHRQKTGEDAFHLRAVRIGRPITLHADPGVVVGEWLALVVEVLQGPVQQAEFLIAVHAAGSLGATLTSTGRDSFQPAPMNEKQD
ncbi:hypothetical protein AB0L10_14580 [Streptomyces flaveolus]|uniref:hypothetical protein n=1 Tax=Streptomyces flaveolus TaxID=67297 RepID=UPI00341A2E9F